MLHGRHPCTWCLEGWTERSNFTLVHVYWCGLRLGRSNRLSGTWRIPPLLACAEEMQKFTLGAPPAPQPCTFGLLQPRVIFSSGLMGYGLEMTG